MDRIDRFFGWIARFFEMGGYAAYVWPALGLTALVLAVLLVASMKSARRREAELAQLEAETARGDEG